VLERAWDRRGALQVGRRHGIAGLLVAGLLAVRPVQAAPSYVHADCVKCHKGREASDGETAVTVWQKSWHGKSADDLIPAKLSASPKRQATMQKLLAANPGKKVFLTDDRCISCHLTKVGASQFGIVCEACHGKGSDYKDPHQQKGGYETSIAKFGLENLRDYKVRALQCYGCHLAAGSVKVRGISPAVINDVIAQGHPPMDTWDYATEVQKPAIFHWPKQKARAGGEPAGDLDAAGKAVLKTIPPLAGGAAPRPTAAPTPPTEAPAAATPTPPAVAVVAPSQDNGSSVKPPPPTTAPKPRRPTATPAAQGSTGAPPVPAVEPPTVPPTPSPVPPTATPAPPTPTPIPTATPFPAPESIDRLTSPEAAMLLQSYAILVFNRALVERSADQVAPTPGIRVSPMLRGTTRAERLLELQRETLLLQALALGLSLPTPTPAPETSP
jgi:cytochrome c554/c'-like protein